MAEPGGRGGRGHRWEAQPGLGAHGWWEARVGLRSCPLQSAYDKLQLDRERLRLSRPARPGGPEPGAQGSIRYNNGAILCGVEGRSGSVSAPLFLSVWLNYVFVSVEILLDSGNQRNAESPPGFKSNPSFLLGSSALKREENRGSSAAPSRGHQSAQVCSQAGQSSRRGLPHRPAPRGPASEGARAG